MKVLLTTPYDLAVPGGVNRHALELLDALAHLGVDARLMGPSSAPGTPGDSRITWAGKVWTGAFNGAQSRITLDPSIWPLVRRHMRDFRPDVLHLQEPFVPVLNTYALLNAGNAVRVGTFHTYSAESRGYLWTWPWCRWINRMLDERVAVSEAARQFATRFHPSAFHVVPNGVRLPCASSVRLARPPGHPVRLLFVGRASEPRKGFSIVCAAFELLCGEDPGRFVLEAVGPDTPRGQVTESELSTAYASSDICIVPSLGGESFGLVALEALAHGVPVIATDIRGHSDWLRDSGAGVLVPAGNPGALMEAILSLSGDPARYLSCAASTTKVAKAYDWPDVARRLLAIYAGALSKPIARNKA
jgi:phosphatidylinositol alpha-mannosyltransferase